MGAVRGRVGLAATVSALLSGVERRPEPDSADSDAALASATGACTPSSASSSRTIGRTSLTEVVDLLLEVQEAAQDQPDAELAVLDDASRDLLGRADQAGAEAVVVLDEVLELGVLPHAALVGRGLPGLLDGRAEALDGLAGRPWR